MRGDGTAVADRTWKRPARLWWQHRNWHWMCLLLPMSRASNNILKGKIYRPSLLPFLTNILSLSLSNPYFFFYSLFPHLSHRNLYNFYRILLSASAWSLLQCFGHAAQRRCTTILCFPPPSAVPFGKLHISPFFFTLKWNDTRSQIRKLEL